MYQYAEKGMVDELNEAHIMDCMECGCCSYVCPAHRPLVQNNRDAKRFVRKVKADRAEKK